MAGILDKKTRFIDLIITQEGKRQLGLGELKAEYASVTDMHAFYEKHQTADDVKDRIYFEVAERPENSIVLEKDDSGRLIQQDVVEGMIVRNDEILSYLATDSGTSEIADDKKLVLKIATGSQFASLAENMTSLSINHLNKNFLIATDFKSSNKNFTISKENIDFTISNSIPFKLGPEREVININSAPSFLENKRMANLDNFEFLPPVNEDGSAYGDYTDIRDTSELSFSDIISRLGLEAYSEIEKNENEAYNVKKNTSGDFKVYNREDEANFENFIKKEYESINFLETSIENNLLIQVYEINEATEENNHIERSNKIIKLDMLDGGFYSIKNDINGRNQKHVFYAGKIYFDNENIPKFLNIFTLIFD